jgi:hypothetical protein
MQGPHCGRRWPNGVSAAGGTGSGLSARCAGPKGTRRGELASRKVGRVRERGRAAPRDRTRCAWRKLDRRLPLQFLPHFANVGRDRVRIGAFR